MIIGGEEQSWQGLCRLSGETEVLGEGQTRRSCPRPRSESVLY